MTGLELWSPLGLSAAGAILIGLGGLLLLALSGRAELRSTIRGVWPEYRVLVAVFLALATTILWQEALALPVLSAVGARIGWELSRALGSGRPSLAWIAAATGAVLPWVALPAGVILALWLILTGVRWVLRAADTRLILDVLLYPVLPFLILPSALMDPSLAPALLAAFLMSETFDSYALLFGRLFGRRPLAPKLSPKKTVEGVIGGGAMLVATAAGAAALASDITLLAAMGGAALIGAATLAGDLAASHLKRRAGIKDFPSFLPPQGGLLDVLDGWIAAAAVLSLALALL